MKKRTLILCKLVLLLCLFYTGSIWAGISTVMHIPKKSEWTRYSYAPELTQTTKVIFGVNTLKSMANVPASVTLFSDDFEGTTPKWTFANAAVNAWNIGSAVHNGGSKSMYISDDKGVSNNYSGSTTVSFAISQSIDIPTGTSDVSLSLSWRANGELLNVTYYDYLEIWLVNETYTPVSGSKMSTTNGTKLFGPAAKESNWKSENLVHDFSAFAGKKVKLVFQWANDSSSFYQTPAAIDNIELKTISCPSPKNLKLSAVTTNSAVASWDAVAGFSSNNFELYISETNQEPTNNSSVIAISNALTHSFTNLDPSTNYYIWYRSICSTTEKSFWTGPVAFKTLCGVVNTPFYESFDTGSASLDCWSIVDTNADSTSPTSNNIWKTTTVNHQGSHSMYFNGSQSDAAKRPHDDWVISPTIKFQSSKKYRLKYWYRTTSTVANQYEFEVRMSTTGSDAISKFTNIVVPKKDYEATTIWRQEYVFIDGINADINLAWHVTSQSQSTSIYIDSVSIEEVEGCVEPMDLDVKNLGSNSVSLSWSDAFGASTWQYVFQEKDGTIPGPTTTGTTATSKQVDLTTDSSGAPIVENTEYEFYVRTTCNATESSLWQGPFIFRTLCKSTDTPFWEGFNKDSTTIDCWRIIDQNADSTSPTSTGIWKPYSVASGVQEGDSSMYFYNSSSNITNEDWLISPTFKVESSKIYQLKYHYKTSASYKNDFEVKLSTSGIALSDFTTTLLSVKGHGSNDWKEERIYITGITAEINLAWLINTSNSITYFYLDNVFLEEVDCTAPNNPLVKDIQSDKVTIQWQDTLNSDWEYVLQDLDYGMPFNPGTSTSSSSNIVTTKQDGTALLANTEYEYYVRSKCSNGKFSDWIGPITFRTTCATFTAPYSETFETSSTTLDCWNILDNNSDASGTTNIWRLYNLASGANQGSYSMYFYGNSTSPNHDDYLIAPAIKMDSTYVYELIYYVKSNSSTSYNSEFEVLLSTTGPDAASFTTVIEPKTVYKTGNYQKKTAYITGVHGDAHIAWHATSKGSTYIYIDDVSIDQVDCIGPSDAIEITSITKDSASFTWTDPNNSRWEYYVQPTGGTVPNGTGGLANTNSVTVNGINSGVGGALLPNTEYEFYLRSTCGSKKTSNYVGPIKFRTLCDEFTAPFWEGFNKNSPTFTCWSIIDGNGDATSPTSDNIWKTSSTNFEGDQSMYFSGYFPGDLSTSHHDDYLVSPTFKLDANKIYKLRYHYRTNANLTYDFEHEVLLSNQGVHPTDFTRSVVTKRKFERTLTFIEEKEFISGISGDVNLAWHVTSTGNYTYLYIDNVFLEEVTCPEPINLDVKDIDQTEATLSWKDNFGKDWEYYVVRDGGPAPVGPGVATTSKDVKVTTDKDGKALTHTTAYEFYVRSKCATDQFSDWSGPFKFTTKCGIFDTPFWEGFNSNSVTYGCWSIVDANGDSTTATSNIWTTSTTKFEGSHSAYFYGSQSDAAKRPHNDWMMSPQIKFEAGKKYRLKYKYRTSSTTYDYEFAVMMSTTTAGTPNTYNQVIVPKKTYDPSTEWKEQYVFVDGVNANVSFGWHVSSNTAVTYIYIDDVSVEEVQGCPEPYPWTLGTKDESSNSVTLLWDEDFGATTWEYYIQPKGGITPSTSGITTTTNETVATKDGKGNALTPNTDYEFYVRSKCADGSYSMYQGPFKFSTGCDIYTIPYHEGFNTLEQTYRCWTIIDGNNDATSPTGNNIWRTNKAANSMYEGDQAMYFYGTTGKTHDDWLVSPTIKMDPGMYVLKYHYKTSTANTNEFEILLSTQGVDTTKFTTTVLPSKVYKNGQFEEEVTFFNGVTGDINLAWHIKSEGTTYMYLDKISLKKVDTCSEPYYVTVTNRTTTTLDIEWQQDSGITSWEVLVVDYGQDQTATPILQTTVTGTPKTTLTGLPQGKAFTIFVRANCGNGTSTSDWSTSINTGTSTGTNEICSGAINIPVNSGIDCELTVSGTFIDLTDEATIATPTCSAALKKDAWFEFTATADRHVIKILDWMFLSGTTLTTVNGALYDQPCSGITDIALACFSFTNDNRSVALEALTPGQKYYVRFGVSATTNIEQLFKLCISSPSYLEVSPKDDLYTAEELIKDVLVNSNCDLVSNVRYQVGDGSAATTGVNTLGYFNKNNSDFPFEEGIVLSTGEVQYVPGPFRGGGTSPGGSSSSRGTNTHRWAGDKDLNDAIAGAGGGTVSSTMRVTQIEFDFTPVIDSIHFEYLFASNSYDSSCTTAGCNNGAMFAAWLIDLTTGEGVNLAKVPGTDLPIALNTIRNATQSGKTCTDENIAYYWKHFSNNQDDPLEAAADYAGQTTGMHSNKAHVVPGRKYHIKLAVMDFCSTQAHTSAVFFNAGSFDIGNLDLGTDLLVESGNALCGGECVTIQSGLGQEDDVVIEWYKDDVLIPGQTGSDLEVCESGVYKVVGKFPAIKCEIMGEKTIEIFPPISRVVHRPEALEVCQNSLMPIEIAIHSQEADMFKDVDKNLYSTAYYDDLAQAELGSDQTIDSLYPYDTKIGGSNLYIRIQDLRTSCYEIFELPIRVSKGEMPIQPSDVVVCASYTLPGLEENQYYYSESAANGITYQEGQELTNPGEYTIYILQENSDDGCYEEVFYTVTITAMVEAQIFPDVQRSCSLYPLEKLPEFNAYYTAPDGPDGEGYELPVGFTVLTDATIYVYAASEDGLCTDQSSFTVSYTECPIQKGISPNGDGLNDYFDLTAHFVQDLKIYNRYGAEVYSHGPGYTTQWVGQDNSGNPLPDGTYYYVVLSHKKVRTGWVQINK